MHHKKGGETGERRGKSVGTKDGQNNFTLKGAVEWQNLARFCSEISHGKVGGSGHILPSRGLKTIGKEEKKKSKKRKGRGGVSVDRSKGH